MQAKKVFTPDSPDGEVKMSIECDVKAYTDYVENGISPAVFEEICQEPLSYDVNQTIVLLKKRILSLAEAVSNGKVLVK